MKISRGRKGAKLSQRSSRSCPNYLVASLVGHRLPLYATLPTMLRHILCLVSEFRTGRRVVTSAYYCYCVQGISSPFRTVRDFVGFRDNGQIDHCLRKQILRSGRMVDVCLKNAARESHHSCMSMTSSGPHSSLVPDTLCSGVFTCCRSFLVSLWGRGEACRFLLLILAVSLLVIVWLSDRKGRGCSF